MQVVSSLLLLFAVATTTSAQDGCDCSGQASAAAGSVNVGAAREQLTTAEGQLKDAQALGEGCTANWKAAVEAAAGPFTEALDALEAEVAAMKNDDSALASVKAALEETKAATKKSLATEAEYTTKGKPEIASYRKKREAVSSGVAGEQAKVTQLKKDIEQLSSEPLPLVNVDKLHSDIMAFYDRMVGL
jgi:chromosome segregation ATPase